jgi:hypothetical protein
VPALQRFVEGEDDTFVPLAAPHTPLTGDWLAFTATVALATGDVPPLPVHVNVYVVVLGGDTTRVPLDAFVPVQPPAAVHEVELVEDQVMVDTLPDAMLVGFAENVTVGAGVCDVATDATQVAVAPPLEPPQLHVQGPVPATDDTVPAEQRLAEGLDDTLVPFADPHTPLTGVAATPTTPSPFRSWRKLGSSDLSTELEPETMTPPVPLETTLPLLSVFQTVYWSAPGTWRAT